MTSISPIRRILIANRGEIAVRVVRACATLGIESVVAVSAIDRETLAARMATRAVCIGPSRASESYLLPKTLIAAALGTGCDAIHPGYGFLSERADFARLCAEAGLVFIGPSPESIEMMGDKISAVRIAAEAGVPRVPGSNGRVSSSAEARRIAAKIGYPVLFKASAGGGGRGMRVVHSEAEIVAAMSDAAIEAEAAFGNGSLYLEKYIERARHIEVQVFGDAHGNVIHLGERDCSTQRRHQKLIEEAPSPVVDEHLRGELGAAAVSLARRVDYRGAGTVEFVFDESQKSFYFLEMNTRIQVEHPVTEMVTGIDLVALQIRIAGGEALPFTQEDIRLDGHAIECRVNAEDPSRLFAPSPGRLSVWSPSSGGDDVRVDTHCYTGYLVPPFYDSLLAKVIVRGESRATAIEKMSQALAGFVVEGIHTTIPFHQRVLAHEEFREGRVTTRWVEETLLEQR